MTVLVVVVVLVPSPASSSFFFGINNLFVKRFQTSSVESWSTGGAVVALSSFLVVVDVFTDVVDFEDDESLVVPLAFAVLPMWVLVPAAPALTPFTIKDPLAALAVVILS